MPITLNPKVAAGKPIIEGTRIPVEFVLELLSSGVTPKEIVKEYPHLKERNVLEAIEYARKSIKHEEVIPFVSKAK